MVQVLPAIPGFGERLIDTLGSAAGDVAQGYSQGKANSRLEKLLSDIENPSQNQVVPGTPGENGQLQPSGPASQGGVNYSKLMAIQDAATKAKGPEAAKALVNGYLADQKLKAKETQQIAKEEREYEKKLLSEEQKPFFERIGRNKETTEKALKSNEQVIDAIASGNVGPTSMANVGRLASELGLPDTIRRALESPDSKEFNNGVKELFGKTIRDSFRGTTTQREIDIAQSVQAEIGVSPWANLAAAYSVQADLWIQQEELRLYDKFRDEGVPLKKIPGAVEKGLKPIREQIKDDYFSKVVELRKQGKQ